MITSRIFGPLTGASAFAAATTAAAGFAPPTLWIDDYGYSAGHWRTDRHVRLMGDVDGDGRQDVVGFGDDGVRVALSTGGRFLVPSLWAAEFGYEAGQWRVDRHPRLLADVDGDGLVDVVGFGDAGTFVARSYGAGLYPGELWVANYGYDAGDWRVARHVRSLADVDGDELPDVVGFGDYGVYVSRSTGSSFTPPELWIDAFAEEVGSWRVDRNPRLLADVDGDGRSDIVGFGNDGVHVSLSTGTGFTSPELWVDAFGHDAGDWRSYRHIRTVADVDADGRHDVVGFGNAGVFVSLSQATGFRSPSLWLANFGCDGKWRIDRHPRLLADVDGDRRPDIVGFGTYGVVVSLATAGSYAWPQPGVESFGYHAGEWRVDKHPRVMADVDGDDLADIVGFGEDGTYVSLARP
ncbi:FG-GAP repeat domain-containing protein [Nannocystis pusilla]|uniref:VCBS repeat-containing protein n=1 Tax=Nannocystis pusilla TaxID=889268 RepID=A0ABS7U123_9BACT|nr:VCBS repeat-containing protein [Nannocystis pusilla]MBZ5714055.1 VCBS repeat-containing protein [Nannocystis pusilla]